MNRFYDQVRRTMSLNTSPDELPTEANQPFVARRETKPVAEVEREYGFRPGELAERATAWSTEGVRVCKPGDPEFMPILAASAFSEELRRMKDYAWRLGDLRTADRIAALIGDELPSAHEAKG